MRRGRKKAYDRAAALERAMALFWRKGYEGTHLQELVETTGVNRFSLYNEFGGKEGLFREALSLYLQRASNAYHKTLGRQPQGRANIEDYFQSIRFALGYTGCFMVNTLTECNVLPEGIFEQARAFARSTEKLFLENVLAAQQRGEIDPARDARATAKLLTVLDQGLAVYGIANPRTANAHMVARELCALLTD